MIKVDMHDGNKIDVEVQGDGAAILIPVNPIPTEGKEADEMKKWGADPALGQTLIHGLSDKYRIVAFDYEGHVLNRPKANSLTPDNIANDFLSIADAVNAKEFAYYGYSWLALSGMQLAIRTNRLSGLIMGGFPPMDGPYHEMLQVTAATHKMSMSNKNATVKEKQKSVDDWSNDEYDWSNVEVTMSESQTKQFLTLYQSLQTFNDREIQSQITCPRFCFAGGLDKIAYGEQWGNVLVDIVSPLIHKREELKKAGWDVHVLEGLDHTSAMQAANVLPILRTWLDSNLVKK